MNTPPHNPVKNRTHPLLLLAAAAVLLFCLVGTAAIMGWLPSSVGGTANRQLTEADRQALASTLPQDVPEQPGYAAYPGAPLAPAQQAQQQAYAPAPAQAVPAAPVQQLAPAAAPVAATPVKESKPTQVAANERDWCSNCGNVESVRTITQRAEGSGLGAAGGAVIGGLLGNQVGGGTGRTLATAAGAIGGAVVGNQVEGNMKATTSYEIRVRLDDGTLRTFRQNSQPQWRSGDRVRIVKGRLRSVA
ncbi:glycine zipper 2TM domain-containing protein [Massilia timonae]|uniref:glycine zipper 2TM domain-containing protein n=1 Tax=Massilia timonae TaxID=47229 RepID=UPI0028D896F2|nr:glycine zipper 2TM domain-containing protein [Massilia timonae]